MDLCGSPAPADRPDPPGKVQGSHPPTPKAASLDAHRVRCVHSKRGGYCVFIPLPTEDADSKGATRFSLSVTCSRRARETHTTSGGTGKRTSALVLPPFSPATASPSPSFSD